MTRAWLGLSLEDISRLGVAKYLGDPRFGSSAYQPTGQLPGGAHGQGGVVHRLQDLRPAWDACRTIFFAAEAALYASGGATGDDADPDIPWAPNAGDYGAWKAAHYGTPPGVLSGALRAQLTGATGDHYERSGNMFFEIGSDMPVSEGSGKREQAYWGTKHTWSTDPDGEDVGGLMAQGGSQYWRIDGSISDPVVARPPISITEENIDQFVEAIMDYVTQAPVTRGWFNPGTRQWSGTFRRVTGFTSSGGTQQLLAGGGQVYRRRPSGSRVKARVT